MWIALYVIPAVVAAAAAWLVSRRFQSGEPVSDVARGFWAIAGGALWPVVLVGVAQLMAVGLVTRKLRRACPDNQDVLPSAAVEDVEVRP